MGAFFSHKLKLMFKGSLVSATLAALLKPQLKKLKKDFDASEYGGAPFLGISAPVIKAHGSSDALAIKNAVFAAATYAKTGVTEQIEQIIFPTQRSLSESKE
jgi:glycerol-3-phosphate acyltransferase PlsX